VIPLAWLLALTLQAAAPDSSAAAREIAEKVQKFYDRTQDFKADFRQTQINPTFGRKVVFDGLVRFKKPGRMRWDYKTPEKKLFVSDGKVLWVWEPEDNQAFKQNLADSKLPTAVTFLVGQGRLDKEFDITLAPAGGDAIEAGDHALKLTPKAPTAQYKYIVLDVDPKDFHVKQSFVHDTQGNINQVAFRNVALNTKIPDGVFVWAPPPGTKIVNPDKLR
jgi:outer membrane lipoprotein carrier protein